MSVSAEALKAFVPGYQRGGMFRLAKDKFNTIPTATPEQTELVKWCERQFETGKNFRDHRYGMMDRWKSYLAWYLRNGGVGVDGARSRTYVNMIYEKVEKLSADLTEARPDFMFTPHTIQDVNMVEILNEAVPYVWDSQSLSAKYHQTVKAAVLYGTWYWKVIHDPRHVNQGGIEKVIQVPAWEMIPAPYATDFETAPWVIHVSVRTVGEIEADYGVTVKPEIDLRDVFPTVEEALGTAPQMSGLVKGVNPEAEPDGSHLVGAQVEGIPDTYLSTYGRSGLVIQKEMWIRDGSIKDSFDVEDDGEGVPKVIKRRMAEFPGGRVISWANGQLLYDRHNPYKDGHFPFVKFTDVSIPDHWYGQGEVEQLIDLQLLHDDTHEIMKQIHLFQATGRLIVDKRTGLTEDEIGNDPGEIWFVDQGTAGEIKWMQGAVPSPEFYNYLEMLQRSADLITGSHDVSRGINPTGVTAGRALTTLQNAANVRIRSRLIELEASLARAAKLIASRVQQFWPADLMVRITGQEPNAMKEVRNFSDFFIDKSDREATFNIRVNATANSPVSKSEQFQKLLTLAQIGMPINPKSLIEAADLPQEKKIIREMTIQQMANQVPPPAPASPPARAGLSVVQGGA